MKYDYSDEIFCRNILLLRKASHLTQKQMAQILGISVYTLRKIESGVLPPRLGVGVLYRLYESFGILPSQILSCDLYP